MTAAPKRVRARPISERLAGDADPLAAARWLRGEPRAVALSGAWAGGSVLLSSHPALVASATEDPFALLEAGSPFALAAAEPVGAPVVGGGWIGWLGFGLARALEPVPPAPVRPTIAPAFDLAFHDHLVRCDAAGQWWFEALWTESRAAALSEQREVWRTRLAAPVPAAEPVAAGPLRARAPGVAGHHAAVAETIRRIAAGDLSQANICLRLEAALTGDPLDLWVQAASASRPAYAAYIGGPHAIVSLSPELFLRRVGREVQTRPIKGTAPLRTDPARLRASIKDRAENVMIVDLMRNDLGRVSKYGTVEAVELCHVEPAAGVWHLVSTVRGTLREGVGDGALLRATFPPGSVTGAPKVQALRLIQELEPTAREAYCGAIGLRSALSGLELSVAIRTFEVSGERLWVGVGGGVVSDSIPAAEVAEAMDKARGVAATAGIEVDVPVVEVSDEPVAPIAGAPRPDPDRGVFETILVRDGRPVAVDAHLGRLRSSCTTLGLPWPDGAERLVAGAAAELGNGGVRLEVDGAGARVSLHRLPGPAPMRLVPVVLPGGLGPHKWSDRTLIDAHSADGCTPLFCDLDGAVLEAGYAAVLILRGGTLIAPPLDGRLLPSVSRGRTLAAARRVGLGTAIESFTLAQARAADAVVLCSSLRGPHPGLLPGGPGAELAETVCAALRRV